MQKGLTMIYWGFGKGKTSAAVGLAVRALGQGKRVLFMQFMKGGKDAGWETGEGKMFRLLEGYFRSGPRGIDAEGGRGTADGMPSSSSAADAELRGRGLPNGARLEFQVVGKGWVRIMGDKKPIEDHEEAAREGLDFVKRELAIGRDPISVATEIGSPNIQSKWDIVILDEILSAVDSALLTVDDIKKLIRVKPPAVHLLMTGHKEYPDLAELADLVTKMEKVKHPYDKGIFAQRGIDF